MNTRSKLYIIIIIIASLATHFAYFGYPAETVFDEVHFGKFISGYFTHEYFFDIHPPLGKLMISGMGYFAGFKPGFSFENIGQGFPDNAYLWLRLLPTLAGALLPIVIFFLIRHLKVSDFAAFAGAMLVVLENALLVQSRFILLDSFLLLFGFLSLLLYLKYKNSFQQPQTYNLKPITWLFLAGFSAVLAASVKWTGVTFLTLILVLEFTEILKKGLKNWHSETRTSQAPNGLAMSKHVWKFDFQTSFLALVVVPFAVYFLIFALHFSLLNKSGPGDAFMTPEFRKTLAGSAENQNPNLVVEPLSTWGKFIELNKQMYKSNATLTATHPYSSQWYTWPFMIRPIYYWNKASANNQLSTINSQPTTSSRIYLLGNPVVWWAATMAILYIIVGLVWRILRLTTSKVFKSRNIESIDIASRYTWGPNYGHFAFVYILNLLPFIGIKRAMFLYHYFPALIFSIIASVYLIDKLPNPALEKNRDFAPDNNGPFQGRGKRKTAFAVLVAASVATFIFFAPLTYGLPLTEKAYHLRTWLGSWI